MWPHSRPCRRTAISAALSAALALSTGAARAHELWIDVLDYQVAPGEEIIADLRVGEAYEGNRQAFRETAFRRFEIATEAGRVPVGSRLGDRPALHQAVAAEGLAVVVHVSTDLVVDYDSLGDGFERFRSFVEHKGADRVLVEHAARGLPEAGVRELYSRHAKALVAVGSGAGSDRPQGLVTEIVALANPYTDDVTGGVPVQVFYQGEPRTDAQVEVFEKDATGAVEVTRVAADGAGKALIPVRPGHRYMLDSVVLRQPSEADAAREGVVWESLWANLTFAVP